jgi:signal peptidase I
LGDEIIKYKRNITLTRLFELLNFQTLKKLTFIAIALFVVFVLVARADSALNPKSKVVGTSMTPNIVPGSIINSTVFFLKPKRNEIFLIDHEQVKHPSVVHEGGKYVKRIVGLPGDTLIISSRSGVLISINGSNIELKPSPEIRSHSIKSKHKDSKGVTFSFHAYMIDVLGENYHVYQAEEKAFANDKRMMAFSELVFNFPWLKEQDISENGDVTVLVPEGYYFAMSDNRVIGTDSRHFGLVPESAIKYKYTF